jgi:hypothetical protein
MSATIDRIAKNDAENKPRTPRRSKGKRLTLRGNRSNRLVYFQSGKKTGPDDDARGPQQNTSGQV